MPEGEARPAKAEQGPSRPVKAPRLLFISLFAIFSVQPLHPPMGIRNMGNKKLDSDRDPNLTLDFETVTRVDRQKKETVAPNSYTKSRDPDFA